VNIGALLNVVGLSTGVVLYAMLLAMVIRAHRQPGAQSRFDPLLLLTSILGLLWNLCALPTYELPKVGIEGPFPVLAAIGFGALGFLPAVVVHSVLRTGRDGVRGVMKLSIGAAAYAVSITAALLHLVSAMQAEPVPSAPAMRLLTYAFVVLVLPLGAATRGQPGSRRALWVAALAVFAVSALHLSQLHRGDPSWPVELVGHHASLPLAFAILYQDYPFALADLFLKRALALLALVTMAVVAVATFGARSPTFAEFVEQDPQKFAILVTLWVATAFLYPAIRGTVSWFVDTVVLRRPNYGTLRAAVARAAQAHDNAHNLLADVCALLRPALSAREVTWREWVDIRGPEAFSPVVVLSDDAVALLGVLDDASGQVRREGQPVAAIAMVPTTESPRFAVVIAGLTGGRRLLSGDVATLEAIALTLARRIDAVRITEERHQREIREREISRLATEAELRALRAQINPHFLFNALTTVGFLIQTTPPRALQTLLRLTELLRGVLRSEGEFTTLGRELDLIEAYLEIESARFEERLRITIDVPSQLRSIKLPPLVLQPLVENAVKHGIAATETGGDVSILARVQEASGEERQLILVVRDTGGGATSEAVQRGRDAGVGLRNVERRLHGQYGPAASLSIESTPGQGTVVELRIPVALKRPDDQPVGQVAV
jgi:signal transduction histidine kinase